MTLTEKLATAFARTQKPGLVRPVKLNLKFLDFFGLADYFLLH